LPQKDSIVIYNPCDSFGIINKFYAQISIPNGKVKIQSKNNNLIATVVSNQTVSVNDSTNRKQVIQEATIVEKIIVKNVIPLWIIIALLIETMIILLYLYFKIFYLK
jgi:beta-lactamase regulating signal transducer with metallopeptidase domain